MLKPNAKVIKLPNYDWNGADIDVVLKTHIDNLIATFGPEYVLQFLQREYGAKVKKSKNNKAA